MDISVRMEEESDLSEVERLLNKSFGQETEGILVNRLRRNPDFLPGLSLVAVYNNTIAGYILFFPIIIESGQYSYKSLVLAPMAVLPDYQRRGIGRQLIQENLIIAKDKGFNSVIVVGHPEYYPKFGFRPASLWKIRPPFDLPDNVFMALELEEGALKNVTGIVQYPVEFNDV